MGGIVNAFLGGAGDAAKMLGMASFKADLANERDEAKALRDRTLQDRDFNFKAGQEAIRSTDREAALTSRESVAADDRTSRETIASERNETAIKTAGIKSKKEVNGMSYASRQKAAFSEIGKANSEFRGEDAATKKQEILKLYKIGANGEDLAGKKAPPAPLPDPEPTTADMQKASKEYNEQAKYSESDESQFGMSESKWKAKRAKEIAVERTSPKGIVNSKSAKKVGDSPFEENKTVYDKAGNKYIIKNGKPERQ